MFNACAVQSDSESNLVVKAICFAVISAIFHIYTFITLAPPSHFAEWSVAVSQSIHHSNLLCFLSGGVNTSIVLTQVQ